MGTLLRFFAFVAFCVASSNAQSPSNPPALEALLAQAAATKPGEFGGISPDQEKLSDQIRAYGPQAVPGVLVLLRSSNEAVRDFAGYTINGLDGITEDHLDALIAAARAGNGWVPSRIGRIGTPKAIAFLIEEIKRRPETMTQVTGGLARAGSKAVPPLVGILRERQAISSELTAVLMEVFSEIEPADEGMVTQLTAVMKDTRVVAANRVAAIHILGAIGLPAASAVPDLKQLAAADRRRFAEAVNGAIMQIGTAEAVSVVAPRLRSNPDRLLLRDIAAWGKGGHDAGPSIVPLLKHQDWDIRVGAARTLGYIQYTEGATALESALSDPSDWRIAYCAAESLGRLGLASSIPTLDKVAKSHWFPAVRDAAAKAIRAIEKNETYVSRWNPANFPFEYFEYENAGRSEDAPGDQASSRPSALAQGPNALNSAELKNLTYDIEIVGYGVKGREVTKEKAAPLAGLRIGSGYLLAGNRGEWGGELVYRDARGRSQKLVEENIEGVHQAPFGIVATVGLAHMTMNSGFLYRIEVSATGVPVATRWKALPGAPIKSGFLANGDLFIACVGGDVVISPAGEIRMASR